ncbi:MAG: hypothetical protein ACRDWE_07785, partial [Acidimicrobiales bacterium]
MTSSAPDEHARREEPASGETEDEGAEFDGAGSTATHMDAPVTNETREVPAPTAPAPTARATPT